MSNTNSVNDLSLFCLYHNKNTSISTHAVVIVVVFVVIVLVGVVVTLSCFLVRLNCFRRRFEDPGNSSSITKKMKCFRRRV